MNTRRSVGAAIRTSAYAAIVGHAVLTVIDNLPDQHLSVRQYSPLGRLPTWRFFGPNPGVDDIHLFARHTTGAEAVSEWNEIDISVQRRWTSMIWNPGNRGPKALFDATQQLKQAAVQLDGDFDAISASAAYTILRDYTDSKMPAVEGAKYGQFCIISTRPMPEQSELTPILVSEHFERSNR